MDVCVCVCEAIWIDSKASAPLPASLIHSSPPYSIDSAYAATRAVKPLGYTSARAARTRPSLLSQHCPSLYVLSHTSNRTTKQTAEV